MGVFLQGRIFGARLEGPALEALTHSECTKDRPTNERVDRNGHRIIRRWKEWNTDIRIEFLERQSKGEQCQVLWASYVGLKFNNWLDVAIGRLVMVLVRTMSDSENSYTIRG